jgi:hypothetical protein
MHHNGAITAMSNLWPMVGGATLVLRKVLTEMQEVERFSKSSLLM